MKTGNSMIYFKL